MGRASGLAWGGLGRQLDEGSPNSCPLIGIELGEILYSMVALGWLALVTLPLGAVALWVWQMIRP